MNKPSERIVVFVTTAQKRAITATAENLGISVSELMRRAVLSFGATSEQVKAASIVDRLRAPRAPDALNAALARVARGTRHARASVPAPLQRADTTANGGVPVDAASTLRSTSAANGAAPAPAPAPTLASAPALSVAAAASARPALLPAGLAAALAPEADEEAATIAEAAAARIAAARAAADDATNVTSNVPAENQLLRVLKRPRIDSTRNDDDPRADPSTEGGRFA